MIPNPYDEWVDSPEKDYSCAALVESYRQFSFSPAARELLVAYEADALREARGVNPLREKKSLRNESTEKARRIWEFVDKAAANAESTPREQNVTA